MKFLFYLLLGYVVFDLPTDDLRALAAAGSDVIEGAITGRALDEGHFTLEEARAATRS